MGLGSTRACVKSPARSVPHSGRLRGPWEGHARNAVGPLGWVRGLSLNMEEALRHRNYQPLPSGLPSRGLG